MGRRYGLYGNRTHDFLTYGGLILVHHDAGELAYLIPYGASVRELPRDIDPKQTMLIRHHPDFSWVRFPLDRRDFRVS